MLKGVTTRAAGTGRRACGACLSPRARALPFHATDLSQLIHHAEEEMVLEGTLHVTAAQVGSCMERFGDLDSVAGPALVPLSSALNDMTNTNRNRVVNEAICLATPPENPTENSQQRTSVVRQIPVRVTASGSSMRRTAAAAEAEDGLLSMEVEACQRTALFNVYTAEMLQASTSIRRQRRRALVRALRAGKETTKALLQAPGAVLNTITSSWDDGGDIDTPNNQWK